MLIMRYPGEMTNNERFSALMRFQPVDRLPVVEWAGWWNRTIDRWHTEGLPEGLTDRYDICRFFKLDIFRQGRFRAVGPEAPEPAYHGAGIIRNESDYRKIQKHLFPWPPRYLEEWRKWGEEKKRGESVLWYNFDGFFWFPRILLGIERHLYAFYDQPALMHRMNEELADYHLRLIDKICDLAVPDFACFAEDLSYNHGPMLSEEHFNEFLAPYYRKVTSRLRERGIFIFVDSDGDISRVLPWFERVGVQGLLPLERQSGVDVPALRNLYDRFLFLGAFDKMVMNKGEETIRAEFERLLPTARQGGFIISCDHQTPPGVSFKDYSLYLQILGEYSRSV